MMRSMAGEAALLEKEKKKRLEERAVALAREDGPSTRIEQVVGTTS